MNESLAIVIMLQSSNFKVFKVFIIGNAVISIKKFLDKSNSISVSFKNFKIVVGKSKIKLSAKDK